MTSSIFDNSTDSAFSSGYAQFKTPFFEISIGLPDGSAPVPLPDQVLRLVQKVEIIENYVGDTCQVENFNIVFVEGSREPFAQDDGVDTASLYATTENPGDALTNQSGFLTDLRFTRKNGLQGITSLAPEAEVGLISSSNLSTPESPTTVNIINTPSYLFQEGNIVTITWGYREFPKKRIIANPILMTQTDFPEGGQATTTIICQSPIMLLDQITTPVGVSYKIPTIGTINELGELVVDYQDISTVALLNTFCAKHGIQPRISTTVINDLLDKNASKLWHAGQSFIEFIRNLAKMANCKFRVYIDPNSNYNYILEFINNKDMQSKSSISADFDDLLTYKGQKSILKSFSVRADFAGLPATAHTGLDSSGKLQAAGTGDGKSEVVQFGTDDKYINYDPTSKSSVADSIASNETNTTDTGLSGVTTSKVNISPMAEAPQVLSNSALSSFARCGNKQISVEFTTLGYPLLMSGQVVLFSNVGRRYSVRYQVYSVTHTLDASGYHCKGTALGMNLGGLTGIIPGNSTKFQPPEEKVTVELFSLNDVGAIQPPGDLVSQSRENRFVSV